MAEGSNCKFAAGPALPLSTAADMASPAGMFPDSWKNLVERVLSSSSPSSSSRSSPHFVYIGGSSRLDSTLPFASISSFFSLRDQNHDFLTSLPFARVAPPRGPPPRQGAPQAAKKVEHYTVRRVKGDGRCLFRALVQGMATNKGEPLNLDEEEEEADQLRMAVADALCRNDKRRQKYEEALIAITVEESIKMYCQRVQSPDFWGGESELLVLSRMCSQPVVVYIPESLAKRGGKWGSGYVPIQEYGGEFTKATKERKARKPVRLLYNGSNHYDLLI